MQLPQEECEGAEHPSVLVARDQDPASWGADPSGPEHSLRRVGRWRNRARWVWRKLNAVPKALRIVVVAMTILAVFSAMNLVYQVLRKPTEVFAPVGAAFNKTPY